MSRSYGYVQDYGIIKLREKGLAEEKFGAV